MHPRGIYAYATLLALGFLSKGMTAVPNVYFRGDGGQAPAADVLPEDINPAVSQVWCCDLASGHSTPCAIGDRIFVTTHDSKRGQLSTIAVDAATGGVLWQRSAPKRELEAYHSVSNPAVASCASDGQRVYSFFGSCGLLSYDLDGETGWSYPMGPFQDEYGAPSSPVLVGDLLILNEDHDINNRLYAFNRHTGELVWQVARDDFTRGYSTPVPVTVNGESQVIVAGALTVTGYDARTGERRWWRHGLARIVNTTPVVKDNVLYLATWSPGGDAGERITMEAWDEAVQQYDKDANALIGRDELSPGPVLTRFFRIDLNQDGAIDKAEWEKQAAVFQRAENSVQAVELGDLGEIPDRRVRWKYSKGVPYVASPLVHDGHVFVVKDGGILTSLSASTGEVVKQGRLKGRGNYYASPFVGDGKIYLASEAGVVTVVTAKGPWEILGAHDFGAAIYATPVVHDGKLLIRTADALYCLSSDG